MSQICRANLDLICSVLYSGKEVLIYQFLRFLEQVYHC